MEKTTRDLYSHKEHIEISNNLKFGVYRAYIERDTAILEFLNGCISLTEN